MRLFVEIPRPTVAPPKNLVGQPAWLAPSAVHCLRALLRDLLDLDPNLKYEDSQRLIQRLWHILGLVKIGESEEWNDLHSLVKLKFKSLPEEIQNQVQTPAETVLELLVRTLAQKEQPSSLYDYHDLLNHKLPNLRKTVTKLIKEKDNNASSMPTTLFVCIGANTEANEATHVITTTRENYSALPRNNALEMWAKNSFRSRIKNTNAAEFEKMGRCFDDFYKSVIPVGWESTSMGPTPQLLNRLSYNWLQHVSSQERQKALLQTSHKANKTAAWIAEACTDLCGDNEKSKLIFDHNGENAIAFKLQDDGGKAEKDFFAFCARCFRCRAIFLYNQIPHAIAIEGDYPKSWTDQKYGMFCAEVLAHLHCRTAHRADGNSGV